MLADAAAADTTLAGQLLAIAVSALTLAISAVAAKRAGAAKTEAQTVRDQVTNGDPDHNLLREVAGLGQKLDGVAADMRLVRRDVSTLVERHDGLAADVRDLYAQVNRHRGPHLWPRW